MIHGVICFRIIRIHQSLTRDQITILWLLLLLSSFFLACLLAFSRIIVLLDQICQAKCVHCHSKSCPTLDPWKQGERQLARETTGRLECLGVHSSSSSGTAVRVYQGASQWHHATEKVLLLCSLPTLETIGRLQKSALASTLAHLTTCFLVSTVVE